MPRAGTVHYINNVNFALQKTAIFFAVEPPSVALSLYPLAEPRDERRAETHPPSAPVGTGRAELRGRCSLAAGCCAQRYWGRVNLLAVISRARGKGAPRTRPAERAADAAPSDTRAANQMMDSISMPTPDDHFRFR